MMDEINQTWKRNKNDDRPQKKKKEKKQITVRAKVLFTIP